MKIIWSNPYVLSSIAITPLMAFILGRNEADGAFYMLPLFVTLNAMAGGAFMVGCLIAEEKEKNTLNVLITSTVSTMDFLLSKLLVSLVFTLAINVFLYFFLGASGIINFGIYIGVTSINAITGSIIGAIIGISSKTQTSASTTLTPVILLPMVTVLFADNATLQNILYFLFTEQTNHIIFDLIDGEFHLFRIGIMLANLVVLSAVFAVFYKRRGLGTE
jgi:ABC-2 type transport system permease protein